MINVQHEPVAMCVLLVFFGLLLLWQMAKERKTKIKNNKTRHWND